MNWKWLNNIHDLARLEQSGLRRLVYPPCGCTEQQGPPCLTAADNENGDDDDYDDGISEDYDCNGDVNDMNGG